MANIDFDLESAECELEHINDLLSIFQEFMDSECPLEGESGTDAELAAQLYANRSHMYRNVLYAAQDKIIAMRESMNFAIAKYFEKSKKKGGDVA